MQIGNTKDQSQQDQLSKLGQRFSLLVTPSSCVSKNEASAQTRLPRALSRFHASTPNKEGWAVALATVTQPSYGLPQAGKQSSSGLLAAYVIPHLHGSIVSGLLAPAALSLAIAVELEGDKANNADCQNQYRYNGCLNPTLHDGSAFLLDRQ